MPIERTAMQEHVIAQPIEMRERWRAGPVFALLLSDFILLGLLVGGQGVLWADVLTRLGVSKGVFGTAQLVAPLVSVALLLFGGQLAGWAGKKRLGLSSLILLGLGTLGLAGSGELWAFVLALAVLGAGYGCFEIGMNGAVLDWEVAMKRNVINLAHAGYSAGAVAGAIGTGTLLGLGWSAAHVFILLATLCGAAVAATVPMRYPPVEVAAVTNTGPGATIGLVGGRPVLLALALACLLGAVGEQVGNLWSVIYLSERGADTFVGGATFALFNGAMLVGRLANAPIVARRGYYFSLLLSGGGLVLACALLLAPGGLPLAVAGFMLVGLAVAGVIPSVLGAGAQVAPGNSGAIAGGMLAAAYLGFMICPPIVGWVADLFSLQAALLTVGLSGVGVIVFTLAARQRDRMNGT